MSDRAVWKMLHLLYTLPPGMKGLTDGELLDVGIDCYSDTVELLLRSGAAQRDGDEYVLAPAAKEILRACVVANRRWPSDDLRVDDPVVFVAMPFREPWSTVVYTELIKPAVEAAHLECVRGDKVVRIGDLTKNVWGRSRGPALLLRRSQRRMPTSSTSSGSRMHWGKTRSPSSNAGPVCQRILAVLTITSTT
jgi:hypothetical protein